jgi:transcriptional regulator NrdR family protein
MIQCPNCGSRESIAHQARQRPNANYVWRSRTCKNPQCRKNYSTREYSLEELAKLIDEDEESVVDLRNQCDDLLQDLSELITQYKVSND